MCRYAFHKYKDHLACFHCRKTFKMWLWKPRKEDEWQPLTRYEVDPRQVLCPQCRQPMADMGLDFRAPKQTAVEAWAVLAHLYNHGYAFHGCGCDAGGYIPPKRLKDIPAFLEAHHPLGARPSTRKKIPRRAASRRK